jgi:cytidylate kinase
MIITIDGVAGSGKSTLGRMLADRLGLTFFSSGLLYRLKGLMASRGENIALEDLVKKGRFRIKKDGVYLDGEKIDDVLQSEEVGKWAAKVAKDPSVRDEVNATLKLLSEGGNFVVDGRDMGTVVFPNAKVKFYIDADVMERARRRVLQLGLEPTEEILREFAEKIAARDRADKEREIAPLKPADDAIIIDTTGMTPEEAVDIMEKHVMKHVPRVPLQAFAQKTIGPILRGWFRMSLHGRFPKAGRWLMIFNHISGWDPPLIAMVSMPRQIEYMAKKELFQYPILGSLLYKLGAFPVDREGKDVRAVREAIRRLRQERIVGLAPEAHRSYDGKMLPWYPGVSYFVVKGITPVLPVAIKGLEGGVKWRDIIPGMRKVKVGVGEPVYPRDLYPHRDMESALELLKERVQMLYDSL